MNTVRASSNTGSYAVDYGHRIEPIACADEEELGETMMMSGLRRAEAERREAIEGARREEEKASPSELFFG